MLLSVGCVFLSVWCVVVVVEKKVECRGNGLTFLARFVVLLFYHFHVYRDGYDQSGRQDKFF